MSERENLIHRYKDGPDAVYKALERFPVEMWKYKPGPDSWSIHEIIIHLADSDVNGFVRIRKIIAENGVEIAVYNQVKWADELLYHEMETGTALELLSLLRKSTSQLLDKLSDIHWTTHAVVHPEVGSITLDDLLEIHGDHPYRHIEQMERVYKHWKENL